MEGCGEFRDIEKVAISGVLNMPRFTILSNDDSYLSAEIIEPDAGAVFQIVDQLGCREADVLKDGRYSFSVRLDVSGMWSILWRDQLAKGRDLFATSPPPRR